MNAKEARAIADNFHEIKDGNQYSNTKMKIKAATEKGDYSITLSELLTNNVYSMLTEQGYNIKNYDGRNGETAVDISW